MKSFDMREVQKEAFKRNAEPLTILIAMTKGTLDNVRPKHEIPKTRKP